MAIKLHIGNAGGQMDDLEQDIREAFRLAKDAALKRFEVEGVDIFVFRSDFGVIKELGFGGFTASENTIFCYIGKNIKSIDKKRLSSILLHELHHAKRDSEVGYGETLGEALVSEGLACLLEEEYLGDTPIYSEEKLGDTVIARAKKEQDAKQYDHDAWFYGTADLPRWAGYTLGYDLCKKYADKNSKSAGELTKTHASEILALL
jgi:uncharacterized protein YjaZ